MLHYIIKCKQIAFKILLWRWAAKLWKPHSTSTCMGLAPGAISSVLREICDI